MGNTGQAGASSPLTWFHLVLYFLLLAEFDSCNFSRCRVTWSSQTTGLGRFILSQENGILGLCSLQESSLNCSFFASLHGVRMTQYLVIMNSTVVLLLKLQPPVPSGSEFWNTAGGGFISGFTAHDKDWRHPCWEWRCFSLRQRSPYFVAYHLQYTVYPDINFYINISSHRHPVQINMRKVFKFTGIHVWGVQRYSCLQRLFNHVTRTFTHTSAHLSVRWGENHHFQPDISTASV